MAFLDAIASFAPIATIASGVIGAIGANQAAGAQSDAINRAAGLTQAQFDQIRADAAPFRLASQSAIERLLAENIGPLEETPGFLFARQQGENAINRTASARGKLLSGQTIRDFGRFNQNLAQQHGANRNNILSTIAGFGPVTTNTTAQAGTQAGGTLANLALQGGNATASSFLGPIAAGNNVLEQLVTQAALSGAFN